MTCACKREILECMHGMLMHIFIMMNRIKKMISMYSGVTSFKIYIMFPCIWLQGNVVSVCYLHVCYVCMIIENFLMLLTQGTNQPQAS